MLSEQNMFVDWVAPIGLEVSVKVYWETGSSWHIQLHLHDTTKTITDTVKPTSHTARTTTFYQTSSSNLNFNVSSRQDEDLHHYAAALTLASYSNVCLMRVLLSIADQGHCWTNASSKLHPWVMCCCQRLRCHPYFCCFLCFGRRYSNSCISRGKV